jgi:ABC-type polysaccharide/polyol phosphate export permease
VQFTFTLGLALLLSALTVHFRDVRDLLSSILTLWFFATPILYQLEDVAKGLSDTARDVMMLNPFAHLAVAYQQVLYDPRRSVDWWHLAIVAAGSVVVLVCGYVVFDRLRETLAEAA